MTLTAAFLTEKQAALLFGALSVFLTLVLASLPLFVAPALFAG